MLDGLLTSETSTSTGSRYRKIHGTSGNAWRSSGSSNVVRASNLMK